MCVCFYVRGKSSAQALSESTASTLSVRSGVCTLQFPETRLTKHLNKETEESARRRTEQHTPSSHIPHPLRVSRASGGCVIKSQGPKLSGASCVGKAAKCNATQTRSRPVNAPQSRWNAPCLPPRAPHGIMGG